MRVGARPAQSRDLPVVSALAVAAIEELTGNKGGAVWSQVEARRQPVTAELSSEIDDPASIVLLGAIDETAVGYAVAVPREGHDGRMIMKITDLFVMRQARGVGVGECLLEALVDHATASGATGLESLALPGDRATKNFFEAFGLVTRALTVYRSL